MPEKYIRKYTLKCEEKNRIVVMSDLHLGEEECVLNNWHFPKPDFDYVLQFYKKNKPADVDALIALREDNVKTLRAELHRLGPIDELILLGDFLDFSLATLQQAYGNAQKFFRILLGQGNSPPPSIKEITYIPGNHDHHQWFQVFELYAVIDPQRNSLQDLTPDPHEYMRWFVDQDATQAFRADLLKYTFLNSLLPADFETSVELKKSLTGIPFRSPKLKYYDTPKPRLVFKGPMAEAERVLLESREGIPEEFLEEYQIAVQRLFRESHKINLRYPHIMRTVGGKHYYFTHGHYLEKIFRPIGEHMKLRNLGELEAFNCLLLEAGWYHLGQAGRLSSLMERIYEERADESVWEDLKKVIDDLLSLYNPALSLNPLSWLKKGGWTVGKCGIKTYLISYLKKKQNHKSFLKETSRSSLRDKEAEELRSMVKGYLEKDLLQFITFINQQGGVIDQTTPFTFVFGHTHKTTGLKSGQTKGIETDKINGIRYPLENTGAWLEEAKEGGNTGFFVIENETSKELKKLPAGIKFPPDSLKDKIRYDADNKLLIFKGAMEEEEREELLKLSPEPSYREAVEKLFQDSRRGLRWVHVPVA